MLVGLCGAGQKLLLQCMNFYFLLERQMVLILFALSFYKLFIFPNFGRIFGVPEVWLMFRLLQTVLFKTDSVFDAQFACFDETTNLYQWIKPWKSYIKVYTMKKQNMNWFATVLRVVIFFIILIDLTEFSVEFCVDEVFEIEEVSI